jgi:hypothetical protein
MVHCSTQCPSPTAPPTCQQHRGLLVVRERQRRVQRAPHVGDGSDAVPAAAELQGALLEVQRDGDLALALMELEQRPRLALVARGGALAGLGHLLPVGQVADMEVLAVHVDVAVVVEGDAAPRLADAALQRHVHGRHAHQEVGGGGAGRLQQQQEQQKHSHLVVT